MQRLVALDLAGGPRFVEELRRCWDDGDAAFVVDRRLAPAARRDLVARARPHRVVGDGSTAAPDGPAPAPVEPGDALVVATSGSSGVPKLVVHTLAGLEAHAAAVHGRLAVDRSRDRWLACLPLNHLGGLGVVARSILTGVGVEVDDGFDADAVARAPAERGATLTSLVPTALDRVDATPYRWVVVGGAADPTSRPANVVRTWGMTETGGGVVYDGTPLDGVEVRIVDDGTVAVRGPTVARGLRGEDGAVAPLVDDAGWLRTGDLGRLDGGRLQILGRADDLIVTGGENVWPEPVEVALRAHPLVRDAVVFGEADPRWGQQVVAVVVPADPAAPPTLDRLRADLAGQLPSHAAPRELRIRPQVARTALGKPRRPQ